ncbi:hypothetical protein QWY31_08330 [Cytophagales bacterium LB-30]|uniref:DUF995 domain-containing protein n=1 Tax=Shiella aurantiaca TaxID=3058365 RepID=A0ABT8F5H9_9BACT|nr:hypothetical protein [Shiella aurantiaca]MDN4165504.1 hypothetical protein [Shiella aurantiaca]
MKYTILILILIISIETFSQDKPKVVAKYKDVERLGNILTRWYYDLRGTSLIWKRTLTLYSDSTYHYMYDGGECATFDENIRGIWTINKDTLKLSTGNEMFIWLYIISNGKLYSLQNNIEKNPNNWEMK